MDEQKQKQILSKNITHYRKALHLTQAELAEKLNYSDKAISKWERAESIPDVMILRKLSTMFGITFDQLLNEHTFKKVRSASYILKKRIIISLMSAGVVWFIATAFYVLFTMFYAPIPRVWMAFIYAIPVSIIVLIVFNAIWGKPIFTLLLVSALIWTLALALYLSVPLEMSFLFFALSAPPQVLTILWHFKGSKKKDSTI